MRKLIQVLLFCLASFAAHQAHAQNVNPGTQIKWPSSCVTGTTYSPSGNTCVNPSGISSGPVVYPAQCEAAGAPSWCSGTTADAYIRAACGTLPASGGTIDLKGLTGTIAASVPCSTPTKLVNILQDTTSLLTITETDGAITFPLDNGSALLGPASGQCPVSNGFRLGATANVTAVVGPAHVDGTQEFFTASGLCIWGGIGSANGATVTKGLIYAKSVYTNTTLSNNVVSVCPYACFWIEDDGGLVNLFNNWANVTSGVYSVTGSAIVIASTGGAGCQDQSINVSGGNYEHANGGGQSEINIYGNGSGALGCGIYVHDVYVEKNVNGTPSTASIRIQDCISCTFANIEGGGGNGTPSGDMVNLSASSPTRVQSVVFSNLSNVFGSWTNTLNDTTNSGSVLAFATYPYVTSYVSSPGYQQPPVLPGSTLLSLGTDLMGGYGSFATGSATYPTNYGPTGCIGTVTCTYIRSNSTAPAGYTYSEQVQISANTDPSAGYNGLQYAATTSFTAGQQYQFSFWGKGDGTFTGYPDALLWNSGTPVFICNSTTSTPFTTTWTLYSFTCTPTTSGTQYLAVTARTPAGATGTFYVAGFSFNPVTTLTPGTLAAAVGPYGLGSSYLGVSVSIGAGAPTSTCGTSPNGSGSLYLRTDGSTSTSLYSCAGTTWTAVTVP